MAITFETIARSGVTAIPLGTGNFTGFGSNPAMDELGNVLFTGAGGAAPGLTFQSGLYKYGTGLERVAARGMAATGGDVFDVFAGTSLVDIDGGAAAFVADVSPTTQKLGVYTSVGGTLRRVAIADGADVNLVGEPVVDGTHVFVRVTKNNVSYIRDWVNGTFVDTGAVGGMNVALNTQVAADGGSLVFRRYNATVSDMAIDNTTSVAAIGQSAPGGGTFTNIGFNPAMSGANVAFSASTGTGAGVYKWVGGVLTQVAHQTVAPATGPAFRGMFTTGVGIAGEVCALMASLTTLKNGIYADIDGLQKIVAGGDVINGLTLVNVSFSGKGLALTARGYELAFHASLSSGTAIMRAVIAVDDVPPPPPPDPDYTWTITEATNTVALTSTRGTVSPASAVAAPDATFTTTEINGVRTHKVTIG